ncbi:hypothetical protein, partial [Haloferula sp.]|uniref:hypothetical protein n=1 Tax=Haloferula sp. TaxID=2497595 RepID=UPI003C7926AE
LMFMAAHMVESFNVNIWYSSAANRLLDQTIEGINAGQAEQVARELALMKEELQVTYENRGNFKELAEETAERLERLPKPSRSEP